MGARLCALAPSVDGVALVGAVVREGSQHTGKPVQNTGLRYLAAAAEVPQCDAVIDFSGDAGAARARDLAQRSGAALLVGSTGLSESTIAQLRDASRERAVLVAPNTSAGVAVAAAIVAQAARLLGPAYACSIVEAHHAGKKDAPSGTARRLAASAAEGGNPPREDQIVSIRAGDVIGEHTVRFAGPGEYLEVTHRATTRDLFALGALRAARWLHAQPPGWWTMEDMLGLPRATGH
jgi:4-hydroxy-tetrahydrodipicolinate reductase